MEEHARQQQEQLPSSGSPDLISRCSTCCFFFECNPQCASKASLEELRHGPQDCCSSLENVLQIDLVQTPQPFCYVQTTHVQRNWRWRWCLLSVFDLNITLGDPVTDITVETLRVRPAHISCTRCTPWFWHQHQSPPLSWGLH